MRIWGLSHGNVLLVPVIVEFQCEVVKKDWSRNGYILVESLTVPGVGLQLLFNGPGMRRGVEMM